MKFTTWIAVIAVIVLPYQGVVWAVNSVYPTCPYGERIRMPKPFTPNGGFSYVVSLPTTDLAKLGDNTNKHPGGSPLVICEDHWMIGPAHALHRDVTERGRGRFSHWGTDLLFSTSDNSDPNSNGRSYLVIKTDRP